MKRRAFLGTVAALATARSLMAAIGVRGGRLGICTFSCHRHWDAVRQKSEATKFTDTPSFAAYAHEIGADGVQTSVTSMDDAAVIAMRESLEAAGSYYEGDVRLPTKASELEKFEDEVRRTRLAGATVARTVLLGGRRYETFKTIEAFREFHSQARQRLAMVDPILRRHGLKLAIENHKDLTIEELANLMRDLSSEWIGVNVDTGNNLALLDDPYATVEVLAPFAMSVHLKDMAIQHADDGFLLSEVPCGTGYLDLVRIVTTLQKANPSIALNLEMATRDPLHIPCLTDAYWATFPERKSSHLDTALSWVKNNPPQQSPPSITGLSLEQQIAEEEKNNRSSLTWMHKKLT